MFRLLILFAAWLCLGSACPTSGRRAQAIDPEDTIPKWRFAGLDAPEDNNDSSYFLHVTAFDTSLFVLDARGRIWEGAYGSAQWKLMAGQPAECFFTLSILDSSLYLGTLRTGRIFRVPLRDRPSINVWEDISPAGFTGRNVRGIGLLGKTLVATVSVRDTLDSVTAYRRDPGSTVWKPWGAILPIWETAPNMLGWNGHMYLATWESGLWRRGLEDTAWKKLPSPQDSGFQVPNAIPRGLAVFKGDLYVGYLAGSVYRLDTLKLRQGEYPWVNFRNTSFNSGKEDLPQTVLSLLNHRGRFYAAGSMFSTPMVYSEKQGQWRWLGNYCPKNAAGRNICGGLSTFDLTAIQDTLYAAGEKHIMKYPIQDVPE